MATASGILLSETSARRAEWGFLPGPLFPRPTGEDQRLVFHSQVDLSLLRRPVEELSQSHDLRHQRIHFSPQAINVVMERDNLLKDEGIELPWH
ncbi:hypothetical protein GCM10011335_30350 [Aureimonas glaciei]|uniref:Uncharacterized protein n=1 Tax=Aureimonas glaciei TaxID=1776957 RepID=A0A917DC28_9HYPH|nr:hypothetical protein GCM10011335_30350 [Aureimonas glaciei]